MRPWGVDPSTSYPNTAVQGRTPLHVHLTVLARADACPRHVLSGVQSRPHTDQMAEGRFTT